MSLDLGEFELRVIWVHALDLLSCRCSKNLATEPNQAQVSPPCNRPASGVGIQDHRDSLISAMPLLTFMISTS